MKQIQTYIVFLFGLAFLAFGSADLSAQKLVYRPVNPAFGGNYLNYSWMLNSANAQNGFKDPEAAMAGLDYESSPLDDFKESLNRQILNQLSQQIFSSQFGEDFLTQEGTYQYGDFQVQVAPGLEGLVITIFDLGTGGSTSMTVPYF